LGKPPFSLAANLGGRQLLKHYWRKKLYPKPTMIKQHLVACENVTTLSQLDLVTNIKER